MAQAMEQIADALGEAERDKVMAELRISFRPEFLNRVEDILMFQQLSQVNRLNRFL